MPSKWKFWPAIVVGGAVLCYASIEFGFQTGKKAGYTNYDSDYKGWLEKETILLEKMFTEESPASIEAQIARLRSLTAALGNRDQFYRILTGAEQNAAGQPATRPLSK